MASSIFFLDRRGKELIGRTYRGRVPQRVKDGFRKSVIDTPDDTLKPVLQVEKYHFCYIQHEDIYIVAAAEKNVNAMVVLKFLYTLIDVLKEYFKSLEEESIKDNFVLIYELLDEMMDYGYPQTTDAKGLIEFINQEANQVKPKEIPPGVTGACPWRPNPNIKYKKNEVFLDVIEMTNLLIAANGTVLHSEITGKIYMKVLLSGMPELKLGLNDKVLMEAKGRGRSGVEMDDVRFHQCVRLSRFEANRAIAFVPPDGSFDFMTYRIEKKMRPLIWVDCQILRYGRSRIEYVLKAKSSYRRRNVANNVVIDVPVPFDADSPSFKTSYGKVKYQAEKSSFAWVIDQFPGQKQYLLRGAFGLPSIEGDDDDFVARSIEVRYEIPYFTVSGIKVRYLKITEKSGYKALPWVRYITRAGKYQIRIEVVEKEKKSELK
ncbi:hypothetical protein AAMO2058_000546700 [Amorphochlora amoebiformis]